MSNNNSHIPQALTWGVGGIGAAAAAPMLGVGGWSGWIAAGGIIVASGVGVLGHRDQQRRQLHISLEEGLAPLLGQRSTVVTRRWKGWPGTPNRCRGCHTASPRRVGFDHQT